MLSRKEKATQAVKTTPHIIKKRKEKENVSRQ
jgi:hypothetical protein